MRNVIRIIAPIGLGLAALLAVFLIVAGEFGPTIRAAGAEIRVPDDYATIQDAINAASDGDVILVQAGDYDENLVITRPLTLSGGWDEDFEEQHPGDSTINGGQSGRVISITLDSSAKVVRIDGFTIVNGDATNLSGLAGPIAPEFTVGVTGTGVTGAWRTTITGAGVDAAALPDRLRMHMADLQARGEFPGGAAGYQAALARLEQVAVAHPPLGAPIGGQGAGDPDCGGGIYSQNASLELRNNTIAGNRASLGNSGYGGGACVLQSADGGVHIESNTFAGNVGSVLAEGIGGGLYLYDTPGAEISDNTFEYNVATSNGQDGVGGGVCSWEVDSPQITGNTFLGNVASTNPAAAAISVGGGLYLKGGAGATISGNTFSRNIGSLWGGALGGGMYGYKLQQAEISHNTFRGNWGIVYQTLPGAAAGALGLGISDFITITHNTLAENIAGLDSVEPQGEVHGGGLLAVHVSDALIASNTFTGNVAALNANGIGAGLMTSPSQAGSCERVTIEDNRFIGNTASLVGPEASAGGIGGGLELRAVDSMVRRNHFEANRTCTRCQMGNGSALRVVGWLVSKRITLNGNTFFGNLAYQSLSPGGCTLSVMNTESYTITNNVLAGNTGPQSGGLCVDGLDGVIRVNNNTLAANGDDGIRLTNAGVRAEVFLINNLVVSQTTGVRVDIGLIARLRYTLFHGNGQDTAGPGTVDSSQVVTGTPGFRNPGQADYRLRATSAARDAGDPAGIPPAPPVDADGYARPFGARVDVGAYEWHGSVRYLPIIGRQ
jgi:nitrous oxidase accessory protein NosD